MSNTELMLAAISNGLDDDGTTSAALDAIREESGCNLLAAVLEVARVHNAARANIDIAEATKHLAVGSPVRADLTRSILGECPNVPSGATALILIVAGDRWPTASREAASYARRPTVSYVVSVGALFVKREASRLMLEYQRRGQKSRKGRQR